MIRSADPSDRMTETISPNSNLPKPDKYLSWFNLGVPEANQALPESSKLATFSEITGLY